MIFFASPDELFSSHDLPVDIIVTPTRIIRVENRRQKPSGIIWNLLSKEKFDKIPILKEIQVCLIAAFGALKHS